MASIKATLSLLDIDPSRELLNICTDMAGDDRVPVEYRLRIAAALRPFEDCEGGTIRVEI